MSSEIEVIINNFLNKYSNLDYTNNNNIINKGELDKNLEKIEKEDFVKFFSQLLNVINNEKYEYDLKLKKVNELKLDIDNSNLINILKYMYYEYNVTRESFISICNNYLNIKNSKEVINLLINKDIIVEENNYLKLSSNGIVLAVSLGFSLDDKDKDEYVYKVKKKINS